MFSIDAVLARIAPTVFLIVCSIALPVAARAGTLAVLNNSARTGTTVQLFDTALTPLGTFAVPAATSGIALGPGGSSIYMNYLNVLAHRDLQGNFLRGITFAPEFNAEDVSLADGQVIGSYSVLVSGPDLIGVAVLIDQQLLAPDYRIALAYEPGGGITAANGLYYLSYGPRILAYSLTVSSINPLTFIPPDGPITYQDISFSGTKLFAATQTGVTGFQGISVFGPDLTPLNGFLTPGIVSGVAAGANNDVYATVGNQVLHYSANGVLLNSYTGQSADQFSDISFSDVPEPSTALLVACGGLVLLARMGRRRGLSPCR